MSVISHKLDAKEVAGGKGKADGANRAEQKKMAQNNHVDGAEAEGEKKLSKKELKKQQKKAEKKAKKNGAESGEKKPEEEPKK